MSVVSINKKEKLSQHFTLGEMTKTSYKTKDGNIPSHVAIENHFAVRPPSQVNRRKTRFIQA